MPRAPGAKNIVAFKDRLKLASTASNEIRHLAATEGSPLRRFQNALRHQDNFLNWLVERHEALRAAYEEVAQLKSMPARQGPRGPKIATFRKYYWYAEQLVLLEAINHFEVFFKRTFIELGKLLQEFIPSDRVKGEIEARVLWLQQQVSVPSLLFEKQLFHNLENIDKATAMLVDNRRYNAAAPHQDMKDRVRCLNAVFQIRHTLSHNAGVITVSDATKFAIFGFGSAREEIIDPTKDHFSIAVVRLLREEGREFTDWLRKGTIAFLKAAVNTRSLSVPVAKRAPLQSLLLGSREEWKSITWA